MDICVLICVKIFLGKFNCLASWVNCFSHKEEGQHSCICIPNTDANRQEILHSTERDSIVFLGSGEIENAPVAQKFTQCPDHPVSGSYKTPLNKRFWVGKVVCGSVLHWTTESHSQLPLMLTSVYCLSSHRRQTA